MSVFEVNDSFTLVSNDTDSNSPVEVEVSECIKDMLKFVPAEYSFVGYDKFNKIGLFGFDTAFKMPFFNVGIINDMCYPIFNLEDRSNENVVYAHNVAAEWFDFFPLWFKYINMLNNKGLYNSDYKIKLSTFTNTLESLFLYQKQLGAEIMGSKSSAEYFAKISWYVMYNVQILLDLIPGQNDDVKLRHMLRSSAILNEDYLNFVDGIFISSQDLDMCCKAFWDLMKLHPTEFFMNNVKKLHDADILFINCHTYDRRVLNPGLVFEESLSVIIGSDIPDENYNILLSYTELVCSLFYKTSEIQPYVLVHHMNLMYSLLCETYVLPEHIKDGIDLFAYISNCVKPLVPTDTNFTRWSNPIV